MTQSEEQNYVQSYQGVEVSQDNNKDTAFAPHNVEEAEEDFVIDFDLVTNGVALYLLVSTSSWTQLIPSSTIPFIAQLFPEGPSVSSWIAISPSIIGAVIQAVIGDLSDIFGRRSFSLVACASGILGTIVSGRASSMNMVIAGQIFNGFGTACSYLSAPSLQEMVPKKLRPFAVASSTIISSFSFICGPILEGLLIQKKVGGELEGWRVGFYIATGFWALTLAGLFVYYHPMDRTNPEGLTVVARLKGVDWIGISLVASRAQTVSCRNIPYSWTSVTVLDPMLSGAKLPGYHVVRVVGGIALLGGQAFLPQIAVNVFGTGGLEAAVWQLPFSVCSIFGSLGAALMLKIFKEVRWITVGTVVTMILGAGLMIAVKPYSSFAVWFFSNMIAGLGVGIEAALLTVVSSLFVPDELIATGVCVCTSATLIGGAIAVTMYSTVFNNKVRNTLSEELTNSAVAAGLELSSIQPFLLVFTSSNPSALSAAPGNTPEVISALNQTSKKAYADSFRRIWYI